MIHTCHARGCFVEVKPELLMCKDHWSMVPRSLQRAVWRHYRAGQCDDKRPSREWHAAAEAAIGWVALKTGETVRNAEVRQLVVIGYKLTVVREYVKRGIDRKVVEATIDDIMAGIDEEAERKAWRERQMLR